MNCVYVLMVSNWSGTSYDKEVVTVYKDEETAYRTMIYLQGKTPKSDVEYFVVKAEFDGLEP